MKIADKTGETIDAVTSEEVEKALIEYTKDYRNDSSKDLWYDGCGILNKNDYANLKNKAMQSIKEHEGFYISRYNISMNEKTGIVESIILGREKTLKFHSFSFFVVNIWINLLINENEILTNKKPQNIINKARRNKYEDIRKK